MRYFSTRGSSNGVTAAEAIRLGLAPDGGLFTPEAIPQIPSSLLAEMLTWDYQQIANKVLQLYLTDYQASDLQRMIAAAYASPAKFDQPEVTPVVKLRDGQNVLELWHGPTCAFKDVALQLLPYLMTEASRLTNDPNEIVILVATSGDTGKAALEGFRDVPGARIIVFFPEEGVSQMQRLQMVTQAGKNTAVVAVKGNFDDAQNGVKQIFTDPQFNRELGARGMAFSSANSINWGRLVPQIVYYFYGYLEVCRQGGIKLGAKLNMVVPTGNFGNILAAYFAKRMGLPVGKLICASNSNNVLTDFINSGLYNRNRRFYTTVSPSMDILISSNLERLLYYLTDHNSTIILEWMDKLRTNGQYQVDPTTAARISTEFYGGSATEAATGYIISQTFQETGMVLDTHSAVGLAVYENYLQETGDTTPMLLAATASPFKFNSSVMRALAGPEAITGKDEFELLTELSRISNMPIPNGLQGLDQQPVLHQTVCEKEAMGTVVKNILGI